ncbi:aldehyde dehydrogenase [Paracoccus sp. Ld10]|uniref:aldehyde dehydrogenase n=1 Tax=Paracoccus sp. Ld10 TaxID=649158 RepID=UPI00386BA2E1
MAQAMRVVRHIQAGTAWINRDDRSRDYILGSLGYGRFHTDTDRDRTACRANRPSKTVLIDI